MADRYIAVAGNMGVGKTTLVSYLTNRYPCQPVFEPFADNPYLTDFYGDMKLWSFHSQTWFLAHKFRLHCELQKSNGTLIQDRTIYEDAEIFATYLHRSRRMSKRDFATYWEMYQAMRKTLQPPDCLIYLRCSVRAIRKRIKQRGRPSELEIPVSYIRTLNKLYEEWISRWTAGPVYIIDTEKTDYLEDLVDRIRFHKEIEQYL